MKLNQMNEHYLELIQSDFNETGSTIFGNKAFIEKVPAPSGRYIFGVVDAFNYMRLYIRVDFDKKNWEVYHIVPENSNGSRLELPFDFYGKEKFKKGA